MAFEKRWPAVAPQAFTSNGTSNGLVTVADTRGFKVKANASIISANQPPLQVQICRVLSDTQMIVSLVGKKITDRTLDLSSYAVGSSIAQEDQPRTELPQNDREMAVYDQEPTVAQRNVLVDQLGRYYETANPIPVRLSDGSINVQTLNAELNVQLSAKNDDPTPGNVHSSIRIGGTDNQSEMVVNPDGSINVSSYSSMFDFIHNGNLLKLSNFDSVVPTVVGSLTTLNYYEDGANIARAEVNFISNVNWTINLSAFVNDDDGSILTDDDGTDMILE